MRSVKPLRNTRVTRKHKRTSRKVVIISAVLLFAVLSAIVYLWFSEKSDDGGFQVFRDHYLGVMKDLNSSQTKSNMTSQLERKYNFTDLFAWEHGKLTFELDPEGWFEDPIEIVKSGKGICTQFSIVYASACLALGYQSRLVVATNTTVWNLVHAWAEVYFDDAWVHVDPSDQVWNRPSMYQNWDWGNRLGVGIKIYAFEDGRYEEVTSAYSRQSD